MESLTVYERPSLRDPAFILAFAGWPDAQAASTRALRYLIDKLPAKKFAEIIPEEFYDFTEVRPYTRVTETGERIIRWPSNEFFYWESKTSPRDVVLFGGVEPNLKWVTFTNLVLDLAGQCRISLVVAIGSLLDAVPHTRQPRLTGISSTPSLRTMLQNMGVYFSGYEGPTGIHSALYEGCLKRGLPLISLWGHAPHYIQGGPNLKVSLALLQKLSQLLSFSVDLEEMKEESLSFEKEVEASLSKEPELRAYVKYLEERYFEPSKTGEQTLSPEEMVKDLEQFLKRQRKRRDGEDLV